MLNKELLSLFKQLDSEIKERRDQVKHVQRSSSRKAKETKKKKSSKSNSSSRDHSKTKNKPKIPIRPKSPIFTRNISHNNKKQSALKHVYIDNTNKRPDNSPVPQPKHRSHHNHNHQRSNKHNLNKYTNNTKEIVIIDDVNESEFTNESLLNKDQTLISSCSSYSSSSSSSSSSSLSTSCSSQSRSPSQSECSSVYSTRNEIDLKERRHHKATVRREQQQRNGQRTKSSQVKTVKK
jgi:hypothetical protein